MRYLILSDIHSNMTALDAALKEIAAGRSEPSVEWRREFSLMLGLERLLAEDEPHLADGTTLSAHQVDALSGTLIALESELLISRNGKGGASLEELHSGEVEIEGDELPEDEPLDWDPAEEAEEEAAADAMAEELETSKRSVYRDIAALLAQRVPIRGEAGIGYVLDRGLDMQPLMLTTDEIEAAVLGAQWVINRGDPQL